MKFKIKVTCERAGYDGVFEVEAPHQGLAETRATQKAFDEGGLKIRGLMPPPLISHKTLEASTDKETFFVKIFPDMEIKELPASELSSVLNAERTKIYEEDPR